MKFDICQLGAIDKQIVELKALRRLSLCTFMRNSLSPGQYSEGVLLAASVLQFAPGSTSLNWLNKNTIERILGQYVSESDMLDAARALGFRVRNREIQTSRAFINALIGLAELEAKVEFPAAEQEKARTV